MRREEREEGRGPRRLGRALILAALFHLLLLLVPFRAGLDDRPVPRTLQIELTPLPSPELAEAPELPPIEPETKTAVAASRREARTQPTPSARPRSSARRAATTTEATPARARVELPPPEPSVVLSPPVAAPGPIGTEAPTEGDEVDLLPEELFARLAGGDAPEEPVTEEGRIRKRVHVYVRELQGRDRVAMGLIDPYFRALGTHFRESFEPDWSVYDGKSGKKGIGGALRAWMQDFLATGKRYATSGTPYHPGERDRPLLRGRPGTPPDTTVSGARTYGDLGETAALHDLWNDVVHGRAGGVELLALVRVTQRADGGLLRVEIETPSGRPTYDRLALDSVRTALAEPLKPPRMGEGLGLTGESIESLWAFRARFTVVPPAWTVAPMAGLGGIGVLQGCDLDANGGVGQCMVPLKRMTWPHLELVAVY